MDKDLISAVVSYFGMGGVLLLFVFFAAKGLLAWRNERNSQTPAEIANSQLNAFKAIADEATRRADTFAAERNELLVKVTRIEGELAHLNGVVAHNDRLKQMLDQKDDEMRRTLNEHSETVRTMLNVIQTKDAILMQQAERISTLEEAVRELKERFIR